MVAKESKFMRKDETRMWMSFSHHSNYRHPLRPTSQRSMFRKWFQRDSPIFKSWAVAAIRLPRFVFRRIFLSATSVCGNCKTQPIGETVIPTSIVPNADPVIRLSKVFRTIARVRRWPPGKCVCHASTNTTTRLTADIMLSQPPAIRAGQAIG